MQRSAKPGWLLLICLLLLSAATGHAGEAGLRLSIRQSIASFAENKILVQAPEEGQLEMRVSDEYNTYRTWTVAVQAGENVLTWDGLGWNGERLNQKDYTFTGVLEGASGAVCTTELKKHLDTSRQALLFALPSFGTVWLEEQESWFAEIRLVLDGVLVAEFRSGEAAEPVLTVRKKLSGGRIHTCTFQSLLNGQSIAPGSYRVCLYAEENPAWTKEFSLRVAEGRQEPLPVRVTGSVMPAENATDEELWACMMQPATVVDIKATDHQKVYAQPDEGSASLGTLHGQSQSVSVLETEGAWARVGAWNHESADYVEGWVPLGVLKVVEPQQEYGLLLDKREQTLTVFRRGERLDTLLVSTGRVEKDELYQETAAGSFLTDLHRADFSTNGLKYDFVIRYDGGNLLHQIPYAWGKEKKDYLAGEVYLGCKASHACIRIQASPGENGLNAYWLWTHLPYHTRLIILDDPAERAARAMLVSGDTPSLAERLLSDWRVLPEAADVAREDTALLTFGGDAVLGVRESYFGRKDALAYYLEQNGLSWPFSGLAGIFSADDWTCVNLEGVLKADADGEDRTKSWRFRGLPEWAELLKLSSVEMVNLANNHTMDYGEAGFAATLEALEGRAQACGNGRLCLTELGGVCFGFGGCRETTFLQDPACIERDIAALRAQGAVYVIYQCHWGTEYSESHTVLQEAMARRCYRAGADLVVGHHPHVVQGIDYIGDMPVVYSLGNLMFGGTIDLKTFDGLLVQAAFPLAEKGTPTLRLIPVLTSSRAAERINDYRPAVAGGEDWLRILETVQRDTPFSLAEPAGHSLQISQ